MVTVVLWLYLRRVLVSLCLFCFYSFAYHGTIVAPLFKTLYAHIVPTPFILILHVQQPCLYITVEPSKVFCL